MTRIGSLFSGVGGLDLAVLGVLGGQVAWHAETDPGACAVLAASWPAVPNLGDVTAVDWGAAEPADVLAAGFPCQPVSQAGLRRAQDDDRWLWPEVERAVRALRPGLVVLENVPGLLLRGFGDVLGGLAALGLDAEWACLPASAVGAPHRRQRVFVVAWPAAADRSRVGRERAGEPRRRRTGPADGCPAAAHPEGFGGPLRPAQRPGSGGPPGGGAAADWGVYEPAVRRWEDALGRAAPRATDDLGRLSHWFVEWMMGLPAGWVCGVLPRRPALKALGNAVVPAQGAAALRLLLGRARQGAAA